MKTRATNKTEPAQDDARRWRPNAGPQTAFLASSAYEVLYGGQVGGAKSESLLVAPTRWIDHPHFRALILRRTFPELKRSLIPRSYKLYPALGGKPNKSEHTWTFPSGAVIEFGHLEYEESVYNYQSAEYQYIAFDELTHFTKRQYVEMLSRLRSAEGLPIRVRGGTNPGGIGHDWVLERWAPWLDKSPDYTGPRAAPGEVLYYVDHEDGTFEWVRRGTPRAKSRVFIPARAADNPHLLRNDPEYLDRLNALDPVRLKQLKHGDWMVRAAPGNFFQRGWFEIIDAAPAEVVDRVRFWDRAGTKPKPGRDPDYTAGCKMSRTPAGLFVVEHMVRMRGEAHEVERTLVNTTELDGYGVKVRLEQEPGSSGKFEAGYYIRLLAGYDVEAQPATGEKVARARPLSGQVKAGNVKLVRGAWNGPFLEEFEAFPNPNVHDDQVDAGSGAFANLTGSARTTAEDWEDAEA